LAPDHQGVNSADTPQRRPRARATRLALLTIAGTASAALLLSGCGAGPEPVGRPSAGRPSAAPGVTAPAGTDSPSISPAGPANSTATGAAPVADTGPDLADIDRILAGLDTQLTDADHDVATPEGDLR
jgi:hypothetical protein